MVETLYVGINVDGKREFTVKQISEDAELFKELVNFYQKRVPILTETFRNVFMSARD